MHRAAAQNLPEADRRARQAPAHYPEETDDLGREQIPPAEVRQNRRAADFPDWIQIPLHLPALLQGWERIRPRGQARPRQIHAPQTHARQKDRQKALPPDG